MWRKEFGTDEHNGWKLICNKSCLRLFWFGFEEMENCIVLILKQQKFHS